MNYRHAYHAGNFADVLKHAVLALVLAHLKQKPGPFRVVDTHGGTGLYDLAGSEAQRTGEWREGIGRLLGEDAAPLPGDVEAMLAPYLAVVRELNPAGGLTTYPGSPAVALRLMRPDDRLVVAELHPEDAAALRAAIGQDARAKVLEHDGWQVLKSVLPPKERRGVVLVDPPFEEPGELERLERALSEILRRFATGTAVLWLPIKDPAAHARFVRRLEAMGVAKLLLAELSIGTTPGDTRLAETALVVLNPPFTLAGQLERLLPFLAERLSRGKGAGGTIRSLSAGAS